MNNGVSEYQLFYRQQSEINVTDCDGMSGRSLLSAWCGRWDVVVGGGSGLQGDKGHDVRKWRGMYHGRLVRSHPIPALETPRLRVWVSITCWYRLLNTVYHLLSNFFCFCIRTIKIIQSSDFNSQYRFTHSNFPSKVVFTPQGQLANREVFQSIAKISTL